MLRRLKLSFGLARGGENESRRQDQKPESWCRTTSQGGRYIFPITGIFGTMNRPPPIINQPQIRDLWGPGAGLKRPVSIRWTQFRHSVDGVL